MLAVSNRQTSKDGEDGMPQQAVRPYLMDLGSTNGTFINNEQLEAQRYYELMERVGFCLVQLSPSNIPLSKVLG